MKSKNITEDMFSRHLMNVSPSSIGDLFALYAKMSEVHAENYSAIQLMLQPTKKRVAVEEYGTSTPTYSDAKRAKPDATTNTDTGNANLSNSVASYLEKMLNNSIMNTKK
jgi:hypothetical protein